MNWMQSVHGKLVHEGRVNRLSSLLADLLPPDSSVLDVGCGDGRIGTAMLQLRPDISLHGIDVHLRESSRIPVSKFDGIKIPFDDGSFDVVMIVDVLHHTDDPMILLAEAARVSRKYVLLKDHNNDGFLSNSTLRIMDWIGNRPHGVALPYNYMNKGSWDAAFSEVGLKPTDRVENLGLYPALIDKVCGRQLHFIALLSVAS